MKPVAIIGGGITGLTAAFQLQQRGIAPHRSLEDDLVLTQLIAS